MQLHTYRHICSYAYEHVVVNYIYHVLYHVRVHVFHRIPLYLLITTAKYTCMHKKFKISISKFKQNKTPIKYQ